MSEKNDLGLGLDPENHDTPSTQYPSGLNKIAFRLWIVGIVIMVIGAICGLYYLTNGQYGIGFVLLVTAFISCMLFMGFSEAINLLQKIADK